MARLPKAIQRQVEEAEALLQQQAAPTEQVEQSDEVTDPEPTTADTQADPEAQATDEPTTETSTEAAPAPEPWEQKYHTLQGIFNKEMPRLQQSERELKQQVQELKERLEKVAKPVAPTEPEPTPVDPRDIDEFGQDLVEMVQRQTQAVLTAAAKRWDTTMADIDTRLAQMEQTVKGTSQTVATTADEVFFTKLAGLVPDWEQVNADERFLSWLGEADPVYGMPRQSALADAQRALDVQRVANVFKAYKASLPQAPKTTPLEKQVSPKGSASSGPTPKPDKPIITQQQVQAFYHDVATGKYRGRDDEAQRLEAIINEAIAENRIR